MRKATVKRVTKETSVDVEINLDGLGNYDIKTGIGFFDHMLEQLSRHSLIDIKIKAVGDIHVDYHHTVEDVGIALGEAVKRALGDRTGINRYGYSIVPMDEALTMTSLDLSNRPHLVWNVDLKRDKVGNFDSELFKEWFNSFAYAGGLTLHVDNRYGENSHHIIETCFKSLAKALRIAVEIDSRKSDSIPSTKGVL